MSSRCRARTVRLKNGLPHTFTPDSTVLYENLVRLEYQRQCGDKILADNCPLAMTVIAFFPVPKSYGKKKREGALLGNLRPTKKPDADNILKVVADSLNGVAYRDDAQIVFAVVSKQYSDSPKLLVSVETMGEGV